MKNSCFHCLLFIFSPEPSAYTITSCVLLLLSNFYFSTLPPDAFHKRPHFAFSRPLFPYCSSHSFARPSLPPPTPLCPIPANSRALLSFFPWTAFLYFVFWIISFFLSLSLFFTQLLIPFFLNFLSLTFFFISISLFPACFVNTSMLFC